MKIKYLEHINGRMHKKRIEHLKNADMINFYKAKKQQEAEQLKQDVEKTCE